MTVSLLNLTPGNVVTLKTLKVFHQPSSSTFNAKNQKYIYVRDTFIFLNVRLEKFMRDKREEGFKECFTSEEFYDTHGLKGQN